jgi:hypothetical protein
VAVRSISAFERGGETACESQNGNVRHDVAENQRGDDVDIIT